MIFHCFTCISTRPGYYFGKVIRRDTQARQGIIVYTREFPTRDKAMRAARKEGVRLRQVICN